MTPMKAVRIHAYGGPELLHYEDVPRPWLKPDDLGDKLQPEAIHDRHGEDQRPHAERDADHRHDGDKGQATMLSLGAEVTHCEHALERAEGPVNDPLLLGRVHAVRLPSRRGSA